MYEERPKPKNGIILCIFVAKLHGELKKLILSVGESKFTPMSDTTLGVLYSLFFFLSKKKI